MGKTKWTAQSMGRKGGKISRRTLTADQARAMSDARDKKLGWGVYKIKQDASKINTLQSVK